MILCSALSQIDQAALQKCISTLRHCHHCEKVGATKTKRQKSMILTATLRKPDDAIGYSSFLLLQLKMTKDQKTTGSCYQ